MTLDRTEIGRLLDRQAGVLARRQVVEHGGTPADFRRYLRSGRSMGPGVCVTHTGEPTWLQRAWAATLAVWPAALAGASALRAEAGPGWRGLDESARIEVAVDRARNVSAPEGTRLRYVTDLDAKVRWNLGPPRMVAEEATLDVALTLDRVGDVVEALASSVRARFTTADRLLTCLDSRSRVAGRIDLRALVVDIRDGTCSTLEHGYLTLVERPHGLPRPERQFHERPSGRSVYRDARYVALGVDLELDGETFHARNRQHASDLGRDLDLVVEERTAVRLGWVQVFDESCGTAGKVGRVLTRRGWSGRVVACGVGCRAVASAA